MSDCSVLPPLPFSSCLSLNTYLNLPLPLLSNLFCLCFLLLIPVASKIVTHNVKLSSSHFFFSFCSRLFRSGRSTTTDSSVSCCSSLYRSRSYVELKTLSPCHPWMPVASRWRVLSAQIHKWTDKGWREDEMKQKAVIGCSVIPVLSSVCLSRLQKR